jgi:hypothetical protein
MFVDGPLVDLSLLARYNLQDDAGARGDAFMVQQTPLAAKLPYHAGPGNHEDYLDFVHYRERIGAAMPRAAGAPSGGGSGMFHSVNVGLTHFAFVNSEAYFVPTPHGLGLLREQRAWLASDLAAVDRDRTPWLVLGLHQPFYCSPNDDGDPCHKPVPLNPPRDGYPGVGGGLEALAYEFGVDLVFGAHGARGLGGYPFVDLRVFCLLVSTTDPCDDQWSRVVLECLRLVAFQPSHKNT